MITKAEASRHNAKVISNVVTALIENQMVDPTLMVTDQKYAVNAIGEYIEAANVVRNMMHMPRLFLYDLRKIEEEGE